MHYLTKRFAKSRGYSIIRRYPFFMAQSESCCSLLGDKYVLSKKSKLIFIIYISNVMRYIYTMLFYAINSYRLTVDRSSSKRSAPIRIRLAV